MFEVHDQMVTGRLISPHIFLQWAITWEGKKKKLFLFVSLENIVKIEKTEYVCDKGFMVEKPTGFQKI